MKNRDIYCIKCDYDLSHLEEFRCPECGRKFDPEDPSTFELYIRRRRPLIIRIGFWLSFYPVAFMLSFHAMWVAAWLSLGHAPVPSADDPKSINFVVDCFHFLTGVLLIGSSLAFVITLVILISGFIYGLCKRRVKPWPALYILIWYIAAWVITSLYFSWDPLHLIVWYFD